MNVVNTRTNILYIHGCHTRTNHKENVSCYSCISHHEMNAVNTRTNILYIHGCHTRTNHKEMPVVTHVFHTPEICIVRKTSSKPKCRCQKFLRRAIHGCMRTCNKFRWGVCWDAEMSIFIHFIFPYSSHFIVPLTFYHTISIYICGFHLIISTLFIFSIISEFMIKY